MSEQEMEMVSGDGGGEPTTSDSLDALKAEMAAIRSDISGNAQSRRTDNANTRYCRWDGQSADGRKRKASLGKEARPFEGASDGRIRLVDKIIGENVRDYLAAATRTVPRVMGMEGTDESGAGKVGTLLKWLIKNQWGSQYVREVELLGQWMEGDTPALAVLGVFWKTEQALELVRMTEADVLGMVAARMAEQGEEGAAVTDEMLNYIQDLLTNPAREDELTNLIAMLFPEVTAARSRKVARDLHRTGEAEFPVPYSRFNIPVLRALRVYEDVYFRANVTDLQRAPAIFLADWMTKAEVLETAARDGWKPKFVTELLGDDESTNGKDGQSAFDDPGDQGLAVDNLYGEDPRKGLYEVVWAYTRAANEDGALGVYLQVISGFCETAATDKRLLSNKHGQFPFVAFPREALTRKLVDSRSVAELGATEQSSLKMISDSTEDHVQVHTNPPVKVTKGNPKYQVSLAPFGQIEVGLRENVEFLDRPDYPQAAEKHRDAVQLRVDDYFGRENQLLPPGRATLARQIRVDRFLGYLGDGLMLAIQLCQEQMSDEDLQRVVGGAGLPVARSRKEIQGKYDLRLSFDVRDLDSEYLIKKAEMLLKYVRPLDTRAALPWEQYVANIVQAIDPNWADQIPPAALAQGKVIKEEQDNFIKILNGVEPEMPELAENPQMRMEVLEQQMAPRQQNPQAFGPLTPAALAIYENRMKYLTHQAEQVENAVIGRTGTKPVFEGGAGSGGA